MASVIGNDNNNFLVGTASADYMKGFGGDDFLKGGGGADTLNGGTGIDTAMYTDSSEGVIVDLLSGTGRKGTAEGDTLARIENVSGSAYDDELYGDNGSNTLTGLDGYDLLDGRGGTDMLDGGYGNDVLRGGAGADTLNGGEGFDSVSYEGSPAGVIVQLANGSVSGGDANGDTLISIEGARGSAFADTLWGDNNSNELKGYGGNDMLVGFGGSDFLYGGEGHDTLSGGDGNDHLQGQDGDDVIDGGAGMDEMAGGFGRDIFVWSSIEDTGTTAATGDLIYQLDHSEGDLLDVSGVDANVYAAGNQAFTFIGNAAFSGAPGEINYIHQNGETIIQMQTGTSPDVEGIIRIYGIVTPEASWFVL